MQQHWVWICFSNQIQLWLPLLNLLDDVSNLEILQANATISCTIRLNEDVYCIRDGGEWIDCPNGAGVNDLVIAIEKLRRT